MNIRNKIILGSVLGSLLTVIGVGYLVASTADKVAVESLSDASERSLVSFQRLKRTQVEDYFTGIRSQVFTFSSNKTTIDAMVSFSAGFQQLQDDLDIGTIEASVNNFSDLESYYTEVFTEKFKELNDGEDPEAINYFNRLDLSSRFLQDLYITQNSNPLGSKDALIFQNDGSAYSEAHRQYHPTIRRYLQEFGYFQRDRVWNKFS